MKSIVSSCHDVTSGLQKISSFKPHLCIPVLKVDPHGISTFCRGTFSIDASLCLYYFFSPTKLRADLSKMLASELRDGKNTSADLTEDIHNLPIGQLGSARLIINGRAFMKRLRLVQSSTDCNAKTT